MSNRVAIMDMGAARDERDGSEYFFKGGEGKSQVRNSYRRQKTRKYYLMQLQSDAREVNPVSNKIWKDLAKKLIKDTARHNQT